MSIANLDPTAALSIQTSAAQSTEWTACYRDDGVAAFVTLSGTISTATTTEIVPAPSSGKRRVVYLRLKNAGAATQYVSILRGAVKKWRISLAVGVTEHYGGMPVHPSGSTSDFLRSDGAWAAGGGGGAPTDAQYLVGSASGDLSAERIVTNTATVTWDLATAGQAKANVPSATPTAHVSSHANGGGDELSVAGLSGLLADGQTPLAHAASHASSGGDAVKLDDLAACDDNEDLNATTGAHGLLRKLDGLTTTFLRGDGTWQTPAGGGGGLSSAAVLARSFVRC